MPAITSSLTALAFAPGALKTTMPFSDMASTGMLLTPAPARPIALTESATGSSCILKDRSIMASGVAASASTV